MRAISGVDERKIKGWLAEPKMPDPGKSAGQLIASGAGKAAGSAVTAGKSIAEGTRSLVKSAAPVTKVLRGRSRKKSE